jgi:methionine-gamma-lyase
MPEQGPQDPHVRHADDAHDPAATDASAGFATRAIRAGHRLPTVDQRPTSVPIYQTVTFSSGDAEELGAVLTGQRPATRTAGSTTRRPRRSAGRSLSSRAPRTAWRLRPGWRRSMPRSCRCSPPATGSSRRRRRTARRGPSSKASSRGSGVEATFVDVTDLPAVERALAAAPTKILYAETIANPTIVVADHAALAGLAHRHGARYVVDNTFASPYLCRPIELGADLVVESATKYIAGHSDVLAGVAVGRRTSSTASGASGRHRRHARPDVGVPRAARPLDARDPDGPPRGDGGGTRRPGSSVSRRVARLPPGLASHPQREVAARQLRPAAGCSPSSSPAGATPAAAFIDALTLPELTASLGSVFTMVVHPPSTTHRQLDDAALAAAGITPGLLRVSVGLEDLDDLVADFDRALGAAVEASSDAAAATGSPEPAAAPTRPEPTPV